MCGGHIGLVQCAKPSLHLSSQVCEQARTWGILIYHFMHEKKTWGPLGLFNVQGNWSNGSMQNSEVSAWFILINYFYELVLIGLLFT